MGKHRMNLRLSENDCRFRITPEDLELLLAGNFIEQCIGLEEQGFILRITPSSLEKNMNLRTDNEGFYLSVPQKTLEDLRDLGRSKDGVSVMQSDVKISLQLDLKLQKRTG
jgi:hypothetical protein